jgi:hypothetical protein
MNDGDNEIRSAAPLAVSRSVHDDFVNIRTTAIAAMLLKKSGWKPLLSAHPMTNLPADE